MKFILIAFALITFVNGRKVTIQKDSGNNDVDTPKNNSSNVQLHDLDEDIPTRRILPINVHIANKPSGGKVKIISGVTVHPNTAKVEETIITRRLNNPSPSDYEEEEDEYNYQNEKGNSQPLEQNNVSGTGNNPLGDLITGFTAGKANNILTPLKRYLEPIFSSSGLLDSIAGSFKKGSGKSPSEEVITTRRLNFPATEHIIEPEVVTYQINTDDPLNYIKLLTDKKNKERHYTETLKGTDYNINIDENNLTPELINHHHNILSLDPEFSKIKVYSYPYEMDSKPAIPIIKSSKEKQLYSYPYELNSKPAVPHIKSSHEKNYSKYYVSKYNPDIASNGPTDQDNSHSHSESYSYSMNGNGIDPPTYFSNYEVKSSPPNTNTEKPYVNYEDFDWDTEKEKKQYQEFLKKINYKGTPYVTSYNVNGKEVNVEKSNIPSKGHTLTIVRKKINTPVEVTLPKGAKLTGENALFYESKGKIYPLTRSFKNIRRNFKYNNPSSKDSIHTNSNLPIEQPDTTDKLSSDTNSVEGAEVIVKPYPYPYQTDSTGSDYYYQHQNDGQTHRMNNKAYNNFVNTQYLPSHGASSKFIYNTHPYSMNMPYSGRGYNDWNYASPYAHHAQTYMPQENMQINYGNI